MENKKKEVSCIIGPLLLPVEKQADDERKQLRPIPKVRPEFLYHVICRINYRFRFAPRKNKVVEGN